MRIILGSITASAKLYGVPSWLVVVVVLGLCPPLLGGWFAQSTGNWDLFELSGSITTAIGLLVASRRYFQYGVHELAKLRADDERKPEMTKLLEDVLTAKESLALSRWNDRFGLGQIPRVVELQRHAVVGLVRLSRYLSRFGLVIGSGERLWQRIDLPRACFLGRVGQQCKMSSFEEAVAY